jgi:hypothetical protein
MCRLFVWIFLFVASCGHSDVEQCIYKGSKESYHSIVERIGGGSGEKFDFKSVSDPSQTIINNNQLSIKPYTEKASNFWATKEDKIIKFNLKTGVEEGTYLLNGKKLYTAPPFFIDYLGDIYVLSFDDPMYLRGTVLKIATNKNRCRDLNGNGKIDTSEDGTPLPWSSDSTHPLDECIVWISIIPRSTYRGVMEGAVENDSLYLWDNSNILRVSTQTGEYRSTKTPPGLMYLVVSPYLKLYGVFYNRLAQINKTTLLEESTIKTFTKELVPVSSFNEFLKIDRDNNLFIIQPTSISSLNLNTGQYTFFEDTLNGYTLNGYSYYCVLDSRGAFVLINKDTGRLLYRNPYSKRWEEKGTVPLNTLFVTFDSENIPYFFTRDARVYKGTDSRPFLPLPLLFYPLPYYQVDNTGAQLLGRGAFRKIQWTFTTKPKCSYKFFSWDNLDVVFFKEDYTDIEVRLRTGFDNLSLTNNTWKSLSNLKLYPFSKEPLLEVVVDLSTFDYWMSPTLTQLVLTYTCISYY